MSTIDIDRLHAFARMDELVRGGRWLPTWRSDGRGFCVLDGAPEQATILDFDAETGTSRPLLDVDAVRKSLAGAIGAPLPWSGLPFMSFRLLDGDSRVEFEYADRWFSVAVASSEVTELPVPEQERRKRALPREIGKTFLGPRQPIHEVPAP
ncbi:MAG: hypothetical protein QOE84_441, partial [Actinomycetota bacterium]|nr:hypothetical protein [Actinomycetota bacterium]